MIRATIDPTEMIFVDESIQHELGYICIGFAYCESSPDELIKEALLRAGLSPGVDEFKSGANMAGSPRLHKLREEMYSIALSECRIGLYIAPISERRSLLTHVAGIASRLVELHGLERPQEVFVDQGIRGNVVRTEAINLVQNCDSRVVFGVQLADFVAYHCSLLLKATATGRSKSIRIDDTPHPLAGELVDLDWIVRTDFRRNFFVLEKDIDFEGEWTMDDLMFQLEDVGAFFSPDLDPSIQEAARTTFGFMYYGCVW